MTGVGPTPSYHQLNKWYDAAQHVYTEYLSKSYTLNTCKDDWNFGTIPRPNHGLVHTLRTASLVTLMVKAYNFFHREMPIPETDIDKIQLSLLFFVVGRENEASWKDFPNDYSRFHRKSAEAFVSYIRSKKELLDQFTPNDIQFYKQGVLDPYVDKNPHYLIMRICHDLDLRRCYPKDQCKEKLKEAAQTIGYLAKPLYKLAKKCIKETGDRIWGKDNYNALVFIRCSQDVNETISKIDAVFQREQGKILHIIQHTSPPATIPIPKLLKELSNPDCPWRMSDDLFNRLKKPTFDSTYKKTQVFPSDKEWAFVWKYFHYQKPIRYGIKRVWAIHQREQLEVFERNIATIEQQAKTFKHSYTDGDAVHRKNVLTRWKKSAKIFSPFHTLENDKRKTLWNKTKVVPLWHGTKGAICEYICSTGFTFFGNTHIPGVKGSASKKIDDGYFGNGIYFTNSAQYAADIYSGGHLLLAWVSMRKPFPVIGNAAQTDMAILRGKSAHDSYNAHYIPVVSTDPSDPYHSDYVPARIDQTPTWDEYVVFQSAQTLPQFWVELEPDYPYLMGPSNTPKTVQELIHHQMKILQNPEVGKDSKLCTVFNNQLGILLKIQPEENLTDEQKPLCQLISTVLSPKGTVDESVKAQLIKTYGSNPAAVTKSSGAISDKQTSKDDYKKLVLAQIKKDWTILSTFPDWIRDDMDIILAAVKINGNALQHASDRLRDDAIIALAGIKKNYEAVQYASERLRDNADFMLVAKNENAYYAVPFASKRLRDNAEFMIGVIRKYAMELEFASERLKDNEDFLLRAMKKEKSLSDITERFLDMIYGDSQLRLNINGPNPNHVLEHASQRLKDDLDFIQKAREIDLCARYNATERVQKLL